MRLLYLTYWISKLESVFLADLLTLTEESLAAVLVHYGEPRHREVIPDAVATCNIACEHLLELLRAIDSHSRDHLRWSPLMLFAAWKVREVLSSGQFVASKVAGMRIETTQSRLRWTLALLLGAQDHCPIVKTWFGGLPVSSQAQRYSDGDADALLHR